MQHPVIKDGALMWANLSGCASPITDADLVSAVTVGSIPENGYFFIKKAGLQRVIDQNGPIKNARTLQHGRLYSSR